MTDQNRYVWIKIKIKLSPQSVLSDIVYSDGIAMAHMYRDHSNEEFVCIKHTCFVFIQQEIQKALNQIPIFFQINYFIEQTFLFI